MKKEDVVGGMLAYIAHLREVGRYSTAKSYLDALRSFKCFCGMEEIPYAYIDKERLLLYQAWLSKRGCMRNTVSTYMRRIRHIYNLAVEAGEVSYIPNLFKGVFTGVESKRKKALPLDSLRSLMGTPRVEPEMRRTQLCFCLMFSFSGMASWISPICGKRMSRTGSCRTTVRRAGLSSGWRSRPMYGSCWMSWRFARTRTRLTCSRF